MLKATRQATCAYCIVLKHEIPHWYTLNRVLVLVCCLQVTKPVVAWVSGTCAKLFKSEVQFGHAGARSGGEMDSAQVGAGGKPSEGSVLIVAAMLFPNAVIICCLARPFNYHMLSLTAALASCLHRARMLPCVLLELWCLSPLRALRLPSRQPTHAWCRRAQ